MKIISHQSETDRLFLARHDSDPFNRWQSLQDVAMELMLAALRGTGWATDAMDGLADALEDTVTSERSTPPSRPCRWGCLRNSWSPAPSAAMSIPTESEPCDCNCSTTSSAGSVRRSNEAYRENLTLISYEPDTAQAGQRALRNQLLSVLVIGGYSAGPPLAHTQYARATNMTDRFAALAAAVHGATSEAETVLAQFRATFGGDPLVLDKWLMLSATIAQDGVIDRVRTILAEPTFPANNPNRLRALLGSFANGNPTQFARADGAGFRFITGIIAGLDGRNPQVAARLLTAFRTWRAYEPTRQAAAESALKALRDAGGLSRNTNDILERTLSG